MDRYVIVNPARPSSPVGDFVTAQAIRWRALGAALIRINVVNNTTDEEPPFNGASAEPVQGITELALKPGTDIGPQLSGDEWAYRVDSYEQLSVASVEHAVHSAAPVKLIFAVRRSAATAAQFRQAWLHQHVPLALRHHVGLCAYRTDVVVGTIGSGPPIDGFSHLLFPNEHEYRYRFFDNENGRRIIESDVAGFVAEARQWRVDEHVPVHPDT